MAPGLDKLQHIVVLMMENRSFDNMLGSLKAVNPAIDGYIDGDSYSNPDANNNPVKPQAKAAFQAQLQPDPDHHFPAVDLQIFGGDTSATRQPNMQGFVKSYFNQQQNLKVTFSDVRVQKIDPRTAKATYSRTDEFNEPMRGERVSRIRTVEQTFTVEGGVVRAQ